MPIAITSKPFRLNDAGLESRWNAAFAPFVYEGRRNDINSTQGIDLDGNLAIFVGSSNAATVTVGDSVYIDMGRYEGIFEVLSKHPGGYLKLNVAFAGNATHGPVNFVSSRKNYFIDFEIYEVSNSNLYRLIGTSIVRPLPNGRFKLDISSTIQKNISFKNEGGKYDFVSKINLLSSGQVNIRFRENWQGVTTPFSQLNQKNASFYAGASKQLGEKFGSNMAAYVPHPNDIKMFNGDFGISVNPTVILSGTLAQPNVSGWTSALQVTGASISNKQLIFASAAHPKTIFIQNLKTLLTPNENYSIVVDIQTIENATVKFQLGNSFTTVTSAEGLSLRTGTANASVFGIVIETTAPGAQVKINSVRVHTTTNPHGPKFLIEDYEPTLFKDFPFDISFIHSDLISDFRISRKARMLNHNKQPLATVTANLVTDTDKYAVNRVTIPTRPANTKFIDLWFESIVDFKIGIYRPNVYGTKVFVRTATQLSDVSESGSETRRQ